jgi:hypothetical protein
MSTFEFESKAERVEEVSTFPFQIVLVVTDVITVSVPAHVLIMDKITVDFRLLLRVNERHHPTVVQTVRFHQVDYHELVLHVLTSVSHRKIVPLSVTDSVPVRVQNQLIVCFSQLNGSSKVPRLKPRLKN